RIITACSVVIARWLLGRCAIAITVGRSDRRHADLVAALNVLVDHVSARLREGRVLSNLCLLQLGIDLGQLDLQFLEIDLLLPLLPLPLAADLLLLEL